MGRSVVAIPFAFFGAGDAAYYEEATLTVVFRAAPAPAARKQLEDGIPAPLRRARWTKRTLLLATAEHAFAGSKSFTSFNAAIERWLHACHAIAPIDFAVRAEDGEAGGTRFSQWHHDSMAGAVALASNLARRYDDPETRPFVKTTLVAMMRAAGITIPARLDPTPKWRRALDAGDATTFGPLMPRHWKELQFVLDPTNATHRRAVLGHRPKLAGHGRLDTRIFHMAVLDDSADGRHAIDRFVARAGKAPFWSTLCASAAAKLVKDAPDSALSVLDRLVELDNAHPIVIENALWAVTELGAAAVARDRLERYWSIAVAKLVEWPLLHPYLVTIAPVLGREPPARPAPPAAPSRRRSRSRT